MFWTATTRERSRKSICGSEEPCVRAQEPAQRLARRCVHRPFRRRICSRPSPLLARYIKESVYMLPGLQKFRRKRLSFKERLQEVWLHPKDCQNRIPYLLPVLKQ